MAVGGQVGIWGGCIRLRSWGLATLATWHEVMYEASHLSVRQAVWVDTESMFMEERLGRVVSLTGPTCLSCCMHAAFVSRWAVSCTLSRDLSCLAEREQ